MKRAAKTVSRRDALGLMAAGVAGSVVLPRIGEAVADRDGAVRIERIGLQLYTVRAAIAKDIDGTLAAIAKAGVTELEFFDLHGRTVSWWRDTMRTYGFTAPATHAALPVTDDGWGPIFERAQGMGHQYVIVPWVGADYRGSRAAWQRLAERLNTGGRLAQAAGLQFGYHNHDFEFAAVDQSSGYDILVESTDPALVKLELDLYWAVKGGRDPLGIMRRWPGRVVACHVKDAGPPPERAMRDVGQGTIDFRQILTEGRTAGLRHWFIEHDNPVDPVASVAASAAVMKGF